MELDILRGMIVDIVHIAVVLLVRNAKQLSHRFENGFCLQTIAATELHKA